MRSVRLPAVLVSMLALFVWVESMSLAQVPQPSVVSLAVSPLSPDRELALQPKDTFTECAKCPEMVVAPAGMFMMGSVEFGTPVEYPRHEVTISGPFAVGKYEVTFAEWDACVAAGGCQQLPDNGWGRGTRPVINASWDDAQRYVAWLSGLTGKTYRLLSESEWEYAVRAGTTTVYSFGDDSAPLEEYAWCKENSDGTTHPVGEKKPNAWGLHDMLGNVAEWVEDCWQRSYEGAPADGTAWMAGDCALRTIRDGSANSSCSAWITDFRSAARYGRSFFGTDRYLGFRVARTLTP
jgi:formylglycine-generating enzyme required for sulfatase activity